MAVELGPSLYIDPVLMYKLIRMIRFILTEEKIDFSNISQMPSDDECWICFDLITLIDAAILPALSYMDCNCCIAEEIWSVIKFFPYHYRFV